MANVLLNALVIFVDRVKLDKETERFFGPRMISVSFVSGQVVLWHVGKAGFKDDYQYRAADRYSRVLRQVVRDTVKRGDCLRA